jgi:hypothetical protein
MWQDYVIALVQWLFLIALVPSIRHPLNKPPLSSCIMTSVCGYVLCFTFGSLHLLNSTLASGALATAWALLAYQRYKLDRKSTKKAEV